MASSVPAGAAASGDIFVRAALDDLLKAENALYRDRRPLAAARAARNAKGGFAGGVPLHWMRDWPQPFPMVIDAAQGNRLRDVDGNEAVDFCLGDTGAMFGHSPAPVMQALRERESRGLTHMLPSADADRVGELLQDRFGLPCWQMAVTASDANRFALRAARAATGRRRILVFDGCYHGTAEDTLVDLVDGKTMARRSLVGQVQDPSLTTVMIPFNDIAALDAELAKGDIACVIAEPVMTNCGMILPQPGFWEHLRAATRKAGTLLLLDETHTISTGPGGYGRTYGVEPDLFVLGKPVAGGVPAAVWGMTQEVNDRLFASRPEDEHGHSGVGTTLAGSTLQLACVRATLEHLMTPETYAAMLAGAERLDAGISGLIARHGLPWHTARVGARLEIVFSPVPVTNAAEARAAADPQVERFLHVALLNRGFLLTPFHNMMLVSPDTSEADIAAFLTAFDAVLALLPREEAR
ncbi:transaminase [Shinella zoogloeoides]|uniref:Aminotransferase class III-fold pyridoxal phosphate-dependent enzyme n=1 Tax=Shinella zoogloeoides TaxID=352475 RepID=A0A6N8TDL3_SHIZO|nr:transaminase [Shinella zoogloeoides]MXO00535.1 aminotransferase class III-fold pyridoxal phosphate-dependent enzyme [Shinella zoogloeoides]UEX83570.1 aminotransferase class III-fold pyridoxal phosphate-dependent enzyme [Shinella zoogloeoides]